MKLDEETVENITTDAENQDGVKPTEASFTMGLTPLGKIGINVTDTNGVTAGYVINSPTEAWEIAGHLQAIATMMVQAYYAAAQQEQQMMAKILSEQGNPKVWTPEGK